jgi:hypothetical protein
MQCPVCDEYFSSDADLHNHQMVEILAQMVHQQHSDASYRNVQDEVDSIIYLAEVCDITPEDAVDRYYKLVDMVLNYPHPEDEKDKSEVPDAFRNAFSDEEDE